ATDAGGLAPSEAEFRFDGEYRGCWRKDTPSPVHYWRLGERGGAVVQQGAGGFGDSRWRAGERDQPGTGADGAVRDAAAGDGCRAWRGSQRGRGDLLPRGGYRAGGRTGGHC